MLGYKVKVVKWRDVGTTAEALYIGKIVSDPMDQVSPTGTTRVIRVEVVEDLGRGFKVGEVETELVESVLLLDWFNITHTVAHCPQCEFVFPARIHTAPKSNTDRRTT